MSDLDEMRAIVAEEDGRDPRLVQLESLASELHGEGLDFTIERGKVAAARPDRDRETPIDAPEDIEHIRLGIVSDTHGGSRYEQLTALRQFYKDADDAKVDAFIHAGDVTQGSDRMHRGMELEVHAHGADAQTAYVVETYPQSRRRKKTYIMGGNHDASFAKDGGINVVRRIVGERPDMVYLGQDAAYLTIGRLRIYIIHPAGGGAYAKSYRGQKISESLPTDRNIRLLLIGHYHNEVYFRQKEMRVLQLPCFQSQYAWLAAKALHPDVGGIIADLWLTPDGSIKRFHHESIAYPVLEEDWDKEASIRAGRGWSVGDVS